MGAVSLRFFSETASAEGLLNSSASLFLFRYFTSLFGGRRRYLQLLSPPYSSLRDIISLITLLLLTFSSNSILIILSTVFCFRVELFLQSSALVFCSVSLSLTILPNSSYLIFSSSPVPIKTSSPNFTTLFHSSSLKFSSVVSFFVSWLNSIKNSRHAFSSRVSRNIHLFPSKVFFLLSLVLKSIIPLLEFSLGRGNSRSLRGDPRGGVTVFAQSSPLNSCSNSCVVKSLSAGSWSGVFPLYFFSHLAESFIHTSSFI